MKKGILVIIAIILVLALILGIKIITTNSNKSYTPEEIKKKILSAYNYTNYTYEHIKNGEKATKWVRGNIVVTEDDTTYSWIDGDAMSMVTIDKENNTFTTTNLNSTTKELLFKKDFLDMKTLLNGYGNNLVYLSNETYNGRNCLRIRAGEDAQYLIDEETGAPFTAHTTNPVPFLLVNADPSYKLRDGGCLADIAPTLIELMGLQQPKEMTGKSLLIK